MMRCTPNDRYDSSVVGGGPTSSLWGGYVVDKREPSMGVFARGDDICESTLNGLGDLSNAAVTDGNAIDTLDRSYFDGRARQEDLVCRIQHGP
jgi:hypothetical protein